MQKKQKQVLMGATAIFVLSVLLAPWEKAAFAGGVNVPHLETVYSPIFITPSYAPVTGVIFYSNLKFDILIAEWLGIGILTAVAYTLAFEKTST